MTSIQYTIGKSQNHINNELFNRMVVSVLNDSRGWVNYGFNHELVDKANDYTLDISLVSPETMASYGASPKLSCYIPARHVIRINIDNFNGLSVISQENAMNLYDYRCYVINHEVGHSLGLRHQVGSSFANQPGSIMIQMSKGTEFISPALPNCWPLPKHQFNEMVPSEFPWSRQQTFPWSSQSVSSMFKFNIILIFIVILIISFSFIIAHKKLNRKNV